MSSDSPGDDILARAALRLALSRAPMVAGLVAAWRTAFPEESPEVELACEPTAISEISLCLRPRSEQWFEDVSEIAAATGVDPDRLAAFLRAAEAVERFADAHPAGQELSARLLAARDRDEDDT